MVVRNDDIISVTFGSGEKSAAIVIGVAACISVSSIVALSTRAGIAAIRPVVQGWKGRKDSKEALFFRTQLGALVTCLLLSNLMSGISGFFEFLWASKGGITSGSLCTAQGTLLQIGDFASAYFTSSIAIHTFLSLVLHKRSSTWMVALAIVLGWGTAVALGTALTNISSSKHGPFFSNVGLWCAISSGYTIEQFVVYYLPLILSAFVACSLFALIYLCLRGTLVIGGGIKLNLSPENVHGWAGRLNGREEYRHFLGAIIRSLLWFPLAYFVLFLPITIAGLMRISGMTNSNALLGLAGVTASLNGLANVLILCNTIRVLRLAVHQATPSLASESFFVPEERLKSPIEAPKPMTFDQTSTTMSTPRSLQHGRAFPPPTPRVGTPMSSSLSVYGLPTSPRSGIRPLPSRQSEDQRSEHTPTPEMKEMWLRHQRSTSSVDSTATLLRATSSRIVHSRNGSTSTSSENIHAILGKPILPCSEITKRVDFEVVNPHSRSETSSPAPVITVTRPTTPASAGLPPPPRPPRGETIRESLLNVNMKLAEMIPPVPPVPPLPSDRSPDSVYTQLDSLSESKRESQDRRPQTPKTPMTSRSYQNSTRTSMAFDHEDFEIQRVESRERLRPAISAVARTPPPPSVNATQSFPSQNEAAMASVASLPESVGNMSLHTGESEDTMHAEIRSRSESLESAEGALSSIAWASLVAHAAIQDRLTGETALRSPVRSETWDDDRYENEELETPHRPRRLSDVPMVLRAGTPESTGANMYIGFNALASPRTLRQDEDSRTELRGVLQGDRSSHAIPAPLLRQVRSLKGIGVTANSRNDSRQLGRSDTRSSRKESPPGYI
ncbi:hypothetical protein ACEPAH_8138 [Sanghuangporus vaninii]